jgi:hypothetical protein
MPNRRAHDHLTDHNWQLEIEGVSAGVARAGDLVLGIGSETGRAHVPAHTPEWTNLNDSDPGVSADIPDTDAADDLLFA